MPKTTYLISASPDNQVIAAARNPTTARGLKDLVDANPGRIATVTIDVASPESIETGVAEVAKLDLAKDGIDVLVNNAGVGIATDATAATAADIDLSLRVNVTGAILLTLAALPLLRKGEGKKIFTTTSLLASLTLAPTLPWATTYSVSKAAVNMYFLKLATELGPEGFTIILHHPGLVKTDMNGGLDGPGELFVEDSVSQTLKNVFNRGPSDNGKFTTHDGKYAPW